MYFIGVMSGTSCDGVDLALLRFDQGVKTTAVSFYPYHEALIRQLNSVISDESLSISAFSQLDAELGLLYGTAINEFLRLHNIKSNEIKAIGLHGQTVYHDPDSQFANTIQLGSAAVVAKQTGVLTVAGFRQMDLAFGGQGAPLAPAFHQQVFRQVGKNTVVLNLGGIANISLLQDDCLLGFDTGPANCLLDHWVMKHQSMPYDQAGKWASQGQVNQQLLADMMQEPYFAKAYPKSTGRELFNPEWLQRHLVKTSVSAEDVQRTLLQLTVESVKSAIAGLNQHVDAVVVCGGGVHNHLMMLQLQQDMDVSVKSSMHYGIDPDYVEAALMGWLAMKNVNGQNLDLRLVTGASKALIYGVQHTP